VFFIHLKGIVMKKTRKPYSLGAIALIGLTAGHSTFCQADIVGGDDVAGSDPLARSTVALYKKTSSGGMLCTATLIKKDIALTAAHCVERGVNGMVVVFGESIDSEDRDVVRVAEAEVAREWNETHLGGEDAGDIALVRIEGKLPKGYRVAHLLPASVKLQKGDKVILAGYGISNAILKTGAGKLRKAAVTVEKPSFGKTEILLDQRKGSGACHGDSGGPAFVEHDGKIYLMGVTSRGYPATAPDDCRHEVVYTKVDAYRSWIKETAKEMEQHR
jgi:secreted trypsin-like serine protease